VWEDVLETVDRRIHFTCLDYIESSKIRGLMPTN